MEIYESDFSFGGKFIGVRHKTQRGKLAMGISVGVGGFNDPFEIEGAHHFLEHMLFKSDGNSDRVRFATEIEERIGTLNADTSHSKTCYFVHVKPSDCDFGIKCLTTLVARKPEFSPSNLGVERKVILREIAMYRDNPCEYVSDRVQQKLHSMKYPNNILGTPSSIGKITSNDLIRMWENEYGLDSLVIGAVGDCDFDVIKNKFDLELKQSALRFNSNPKIIAPEVNPPNLYLEKRQGIDSAHVAFAVPIAPPGTKEYVAFELLDEELNGGFLTSKLYASLREKRGLCYSVETNLYNDRGAAYYLVSLSTDPEKVPFVLDRINDEFKMIEDMTQERLDRIKTRFSDRKLDEFNDRDELGLLDFLFDAYENKTSFRDYLHLSNGVHEVDLDLIKRVARIPKPTVFVLSPREIQGLEI